jgi:hypothetical protein
VFSLVMPLPLGFMQCKNGCKNHLGGGWGLVLYVFHKAYHEITMPTCRAEEILRVIMCWPPAL